VPPRAPGAPAATTEAPKPPAPAPRKSSTIKTPALPRKDGSDGHSARPPRETISIDADQLAAEVLSQEEKPPEEEEVVEGKPIKVKCYYCEEEHQYPAELGGKNAPCQSCKKIIKIPLPVSTKAKDWREVDHKPSGARRDLDAPDDTWGTAQRAAVSTEALIEAEAVPVQYAPVSRIKRIKRWVGIVLVLSAVGALGYFGWRFRQEKKQTQAIDRAIAYLNPKKGEKPLLTPDAAAEVHRAAGEFYVRDDNPGEAIQQFKHARGNLSGLKQGAPERDLALLELALAESDLAGTQDQVLDRTREKWDKVRPMLRAVLSQVYYREVRVDAVRQMSHKLLARGKREGTQAAMGREAESLAAQMATLDERPELLGQVGIAVLLARDKPDDTQAAKDVAKNALTAWAQAKGDPAKGGAPSLAALLYALGQEPEATGVAPSPPGQGAYSRDTRLAYSQGYALKDNNWDRARELAYRTGDLPHRLEALICLAELAVDAGKTDVAAAIVDDVLKLVDLRDPKKAAALKLPAWLPYRFVRAAARCGRVKEARETAEAAFAGNPMLLNRSLFEVWRGDLAARGGQPAMDEMQREANKKQDAFPPTLELLARHNARYGSAGSVEAEVAQWQPESLRPSGYVGVALGMQEAMHGATQTAKAKK
jgi:hypothetical protein